MNVGPGSTLEIPAEIDYTRPFAGADWAAWDEEYVANVRPQERLRPQWGDEAFGTPADDTPQAWWDAWHGYSDDEFQEMMVYE